MALVWRIYGGGDCESSGESNSGECRWSRLPSAIDDRLWRADAVGEVVVCYRNGGVIGQPYSKATALNWRKAKLFAAVDFVFFPL